MTLDGGEYGSDRNRDSDAPPADSLSNDGHIYTVGTTPGSLDYLRADGTWISAPVIGGRLVDGAIVAKTTRDPLSDRDFKLA